jgi:hypothetical protein
VTVGDVFGLSDLVDSGALAPNSTVLVAVDR